MGSHDVFHHNLFTICSAMSDKCAISRTTKEFRRAYLLFFVGDCVGVCADGANETLDTAFVIALVDRSSSAFLVTCVRPESHSSSAGSFNSRSIAVMRLFCAISQVLLLLVLLSQLSCIGSVNSEEGKGWNFVCLCMLNFSLFMHPAGERLPARGDLLLILRLDVGVFVAVMVLVL